MSDLRGIDVNLIVVLDAILTERSITRAGDAIGLTQPAVSGSLARLRRLLDDPIVVRNGRSFELTPRARELEPVVKEALTEIGRTFNLRPSFDPATSDRHFYISASDYALTTLTAPLRSLLEKEAPRTLIDFDTFIGNDPLDLLRKDLVIAAAGRGLPGKRQSLFSDTFVCLVRHDHPLLDEGALDLEALQAMPFLRTIVADNVVTSSEETLLAAGVTPHVAMSVRGFMSAPFMLAGTDMYGFVPKRVADLFAEALGLIAATTPLNHTTLVEVAYWHPSKSSDPALRWLVGTLRRAAELVEFGADGIEGR